jgi:hypothetical protein
MNGQIEITPVNAASLSPTKWKQQLFTAGFLVISAVVMIGWLTALGWAAIKFAEWLFF